MQTCDIEKTVGGVGIPW